MPSKLVSYQQEIFSMIEDQGLTYSQVALYLSGKGINISRQSVHSWYTRLRKKIVKRKQQSNLVIKPELGSNSDKSNNDLTNSKRHQKIPLAELKKAPQESIQAALNKFEQKNKSGFFFPDLNFSASSRNEQNTRKVRNAHK